MTTLLRVAKAVGLYGVAGGLLWLPMQAQASSPGATTGGLKVVRADSFATPVNGVYPAEALAGAYRATAAGGTIVLGDGIYVSPFTAGGMLIETPRTFVGAGRPLPDSETQPTRLARGSIVLGEVRGTAAVQMFDLGIDDGPTAAAYFGGYRGFGLVLGHNAGMAAASGTRLKNVSVLTTGVTDQHSVIVEGQHDLAIDGLWIWTLGGVHGLMIKSGAVQVRNFHCAGAASDCLILKSDDATTGHGNSGKVTLEDLDLHALATPGDTGGVLIDARWDSVRFVRFERLRETGLSFGVKVAGSWFYGAHDVQVSDWSAQGLTGSCLLMQRSEPLVLSHASCGAGPVLAEALPEPWGNAIKLHAHILVWTAETHRRASLFAGLGLGLGLCAAALWWRRRVLR